MAEVKRSKQTWVRWIGSGISMLLFIWLVARQDWSDILLRLQQIPAWFYLVILLFYYAGMFANAWRWHLLLQAPKILVGFWTTTRIVFLGAFISNFLPSTVGGDTARWISMSRHTGDKAITFTSIALDRLVNVAAFLTILPLSLVTFGGTLTTIFAFTPSSFNGVFFMSTLEPPRLNWKTKLGYWIKRVKETFHIWLNQPWLLAKAFIVSWFSIFIVMVGVWLLARALGIQVALYQVMGVNAITYFLTLIPISVNGYGIREVAMTTLYTSLGASVEQAAALAMITRLMAMIETLPGALWMNELMPEIETKK